LTVMNYSRIRMILGAGAAVLIWSSGVRAQPPQGSQTITEADCTAAKLGDSIDTSAIGEPVSAVTLSEPRWNAAGKAGGGPYCIVNGAIAPVDRSPNAKPINFQVALIKDGITRIVNGLEEEDSHAKPQSRQDAAKRMP